MNTINVPFDDEEFDRLQEVKGKMSWHDFIIKAANRMALQDEMAKNLPRLTKK